jgi:transcriptional regulator with XRE-family HTH domain
MLNTCIDKIEQRLQEMHEKQSFEEMGKKLNISTSNVARMVNGSQPIKSPSVDLLLKVFPKCKIDFHGNSMDSANCVPKEKVEEKVAAAKKEGRESFRNRAIMAVLALENIPSDVAMEVLKALKDL